MSNDISQARMRRSKCSLKRATTEPIHSWRVRPVNENSLFQATYGSTTKQDRYRLYDVRGVWRPATFFRLAIWFLAPVTLFEISRYIMPVHINTRSIVSIVGTLSGLCYPQYVISTPRVRSYTTQPPAVVSITPLRRRRLQRHCRRPQDWACFELCEGVVHRV